MADIIGDIIKREGGLVNDKDDLGGPTFEGISKVANPGAWASGQPTQAEVRAIYEQKYLKGPGFDKITDKQLQVQLIDFGVNSGPMVAIQKLQDILHVTVDGVLGPETLAALAANQDINNLLVAARIRMIGKIVSKNPSQVKFLSGWLERSLEFLI
jgi:lysozyme family protein